MVPEKTLEARGRNLIDFVLSFYVDIYYPLLN